MHGSQITLNEPCMIVAFMLVNSLFVEIAQTIVRAANGSRI